MWNWVSLRRDALLGCAHVAVSFGAALFSCSLLPSWRDLVPQLLPLGNALDSYLLAASTEFEPEVSSRLLCQGKNNF